MRGLAAVARVLWQVWPSGARALLLPLLVCVAVASVAETQAAPREGFTAAPAANGSAPVAGGTQALVATAHLPLHATVITPRLVGSAFKIAPGLAVTAAHVVEGMAPGGHVTLRRGPAGGPTIAARLVGVSSTMDLAVLEIPSGFLPTLGQEIVDRAGAAVATPPPTPPAGMRLHASGSVPARDPLIAVPRNVSGEATGRTVDVPRLGPGFVATLPGTVPGFSGGPVMDTSGKLAGMIIAIRRLPVAGRYDAHPVRPALTDDVYVLAAEALVAEAQRIVARSASIRTARP